MAIVVQQISTTVWILQGLMPSQSPQAVLQAAALSVGSQAIDSDNRIVWEVDINTSSMTNVWTTYTSQSSVRGFAVAAEVINGGYVVYLDAAGKLRAAATSIPLSTGRVCGLAENSVSSGQVCTFVGAGEFSVPVALSPGDTAWVSPVVGAIASSASPTGYIQSLGIVRSDGVLMVRLGGVIKRS